MDILKGIAEKRLRPQHEEDIVDRANYVTTPFILVTAAIISFAKEYGPFSEPLTCWTQAEWNDQWLQYAHDFCFVESTYYVPRNETMPVRGLRNNDTDRVSYYQWLPFILVVQALICQMPKYFWTICNDLSSKDLPSILRQAHDVSGNENERSVAKGIARHLLATLGHEVGHQSRQQRCCLVRMFNYVIKQVSRNMLCFFYLAMKCLFLIIMISQFLFISLFLGVNQTPQWGLQMLDAFITHGTAWEKNGLFPRVTYCDFKIRMPGDHDSIPYHDYTVQCVLIANFLNEKIFLTLYYWFVFMALLTLLNLVRWCCLLFRPSHGYVRKMVELSSLQIFPDPEFNFNDEEEEESADDSDPEETALLDLPSVVVFRHSHLSAANSNATTSSYVSSNGTATTTNNPAIVANLVNRFEANNIQQQNQDESTDSNGTVSPSSAASSEQSIQQELVQPNDEWENKLMAAMEKRVEFYKAFNRYSDKFIEFLGADGILIFQLIRANAGPQMASLIAGNMFNLFQLSKNRKAIGGQSPKKVSHEGNSLPI